MPRLKQKMRQAAAIVWLDASHAAEDDDRSLKPALAIVYGEILEMTDDYIKIAGEWFKDKDFTPREVRCIPKGMIVKVYGVHLPDPFTEKDVT